MAYTTTQIKQIQTVLKNHGNYTGKIDGIWGTYSIAATKEARQSLYCLIDTTINVVESEIKMSEFDQKMLTYNYGIDCDKLRQLGGSS